MTSFGERVRQRRLTARLRQADFLAYGLTQSQLSLIESSTIVPSPDKIDRIAAALHAAPLNLVAGTEIEAAYTAARFTAEEQAVLAFASRLSRSQRLVTVQESYRRLELFFRIMRFGSAPLAIHVDDEMTFQRGARIFHRLLDVAREDDWSLGKAMFLPQSLIEEPRIALSQLRVLMQRSLAYVSSLVLEHAEAGDTLFRRDIALRIGLARVDEHLERLMPGALITAERAGNRVDLR